MEGGGGGVLVGGADVAASVAVVLRCQLHCPLPPMFELIQVSNLSVVS